MSSRVQSQPTAGATGLGPGWVPVRLTPERLLWALVVVTMVLDVVTTEVGLQHGLAEGNPVMAGVIGGAGLLGLAGAKLAVLAVGACARLCLPRYRYAIPLGLATPGAIAVAINTVLLLGL
jgi:hypothetical protein